ncbi:glycosyltransferase family 4 protein [bacterium]|nr:glycosyltransferase family 4 protein [candidate division CSSED10-310 bacterium]
MTQQVRDKRIGIVSRGDIFPPQHGAAAKIFYTAKYLSHWEREVYLITDRTPGYHRVVAGHFEEFSYPRWVSLYPTMHRWSPRLLRLLGVPANDHLLFMPIFDLNLWVRTLYVARRHRLDLLQAEFPCYTAPVLFAAFPLGLATALVEHNVEYARIMERDRLSRRGRWFMRRSEKYFCTAVDHLVAVSRQDRDRLERLLGIDAGRVAVIPHGVDMTQYQAVNGDAIRRRYRLEGTTVLIYHANFQYPPNVEAVKLLARQIMPLARQRGLTVKALVVGLDPPRRYRDRDIIFTGVVDDLPEHIAAADIAVVPLRKGGGTRLKILEYFAAGIPVVSTLKGAEGITARDGEEIILADSAEDMVSAISALIESPETARRIGVNGRRFTEQFDWLRICEDYARLFDGRET